MFPTIADYAVKIGELAGSECGMSAYAGSGPEIAEKNSEGGRSPPSIKLFISMVYRPNLRRIMPASPTALPNNATVAGSGIAG